MNRPATIAIIGGGVSGLSAGGLLCQAGHQVKVFEINDKLGGCCANTNIEGYTFHDGATFLVLTGVLDQVFERLGIDRASLLPLRKLKNIYSATLPNGTTVTLGNNFDIKIEGNKTSVDEFKLQQEIQRLMHKWRPVLQLFEGDIILHPLSLLRLVTKGWRHLPKFHGTVASELNSFISDDNVRATMAGMLLHAGLPVDKLPVYSILGLISMLKDGIYLPDGGMGRIPQVLCKPIIENGGEIYLNSKVNKIVVKKGRVCGLEVDHKGLIEVDAIISTVSGMTTFDTLMDPEDVPDAIKRKVSNAPLSHRSLSIQLGLSRSIEVASHINSVSPFMDEQYKVFMIDQYAAKYFNYSVPTVTMPELAPPGASIVEMFVPLVNDEFIETRNDKKIEKISQETIAALSRIHQIDVAVKRIRSPKDFQNDLHLYKGALYGLSPIADPRAQFSHTSPIRGLYQAGQTTYPGFGVPSSAMSGIFAAEMLLNSEILNQKTFTQSRSQKIHHAS